MSRVPMGKVLLRNVIRHTDAHNKIQEESEMWKLRGMEKGPSTSHRPMPPASNSSRLGDGLRRREHSFGQDEREARYWTKKLYDFEANDPDRWGHSGFKELYPEEFKSDWERDRGDDQNVHCRKKNTKSRLKTAKSKHLKKSSKKKKKKKEEKRRRTGESDGESSSKSVKQKRKSSKSKHKRKKSEREEESSSEDNDEERGRRKKRQRDSHRDSGPESHKKRRKNWKAGEDKLEDSSED
ncbi:unnamed protein product [Coregonus sp. 'balchen']|nr:unnamed protein product [Coregonus sp. 'balchen']